MATVVVKAYLEYPDTSVETRRFNIEKETIPNAGIYNKVHEQVEKAFPLLKGKKFTLFWKDEDDDFVTVSKDEEIQDVMSKDNCKFYIKVNEEVNEDETTDNLTQESSNEEEMVEVTEKGNHDIADPMEKAEKSDEREIGLSTPPFGFQAWGGHGDWKGRGRHMHRHGHDGHRGFHPKFHGGMEDGRHRGPWGHHQGRWGHHHGGQKGKHCGEDRGDDMGRHHGGQKGGHCGENRGDGWSHHGGQKGGHCGEDRGDGWGHHGGQKGGHCDKHRGDGWGCHHRGGHHGGPGGHHGGPRGHHGGPRGQHCEGYGKHGCKRQFSPERRRMNCHGGKHAWKKGLRESVPKSHRRWAKAFIQNWRKEHVKNATTTTSDSDSNVDLKTMMTSEGIPEAYADWLKLKLICWHARWSKDEMESGMGDESLESHHETKRVLKPSVLVEFRKWTNWYINSHFGERHPPMFKRHFGGCHFKDMMAMKKKYFENSVPKGFQLWTKQFIRDWRAEKKLNDPSSGNDAADSDMNGDGNEPTQVPDEYKQWLEIFLVKWHSWRGQIPRNPGQDMRRCKGQFKDTVPEDYRCWVKFYLSSRYANKMNRKTQKDSDDDVTQRKYNKMLTAFQKMWVQQQQDDTTTDEDKAGTGFLSSGTDDDNGEPESSFQHLSLDSDSDGHRGHHRVRFDKHSDKKQWKRMKKHPNGDFDPFVMVDEDHHMRRFQRKVPMKFEFRQWAKQALTQWDGKTLNEGNEAQQNEEFSLPPNVYHWMYKTMMKNQMKKMKQELKATRKEMKDAKKMEK